MKRFLPIALVLASTSFGLVGCSETTKESVVSTKETPNGEVKTKETKETTASGDQKPAH